MAEHQGAKVEVGLTASLDYCDGSEDHRYRMASAAPVADVYRIRGRKPYPSLLSLCRACAVKLAIEILEEEFE